MLQEPNENFDFSSLKLGPPNGLQGGSYFTKLLNNDETLYLQVPKCNTKQGMVVTEKKKYCDLMFSRDATDVISWFENIEKRVQVLLFEKKNIWFHDDLEFSDIENAFTSPIRCYKSGNFYLVRCTIPKVISPETITCYNECEEPISLDILSEPDVEVIPLIEIQGVKFSSKSFQLEIGLRQIMVIKKKRMFENCMIKLNKVEESVPVEPVPEPVVNVEAEPVVNVEAEPVVNVEAEPVVEVTVEAVTEPQVESGSVAEAEPVIEVQTDDMPESDKEEMEPLFQSVSKDVEEKSEIKEVVSATREDNNDIQEISIDNIEENEPLVLKKPSDVYYEMWRSARQKAKQARKEALAAYLEAKKIKENYMLEGIDTDSDDENEIPAVI